jgi:hypothetical protein
MPDDDLIAIHESGHVWMAIALGLPLRVTTWWMDFNPARRLDRAFEF